MDEYRVELPAFHGPLDLLLYLVKRSEVDLLDIPIASITDQFLAYLNLLQTIDVELAGDFLVTAATLMEIKSKQLLPDQTEPEPVAVETSDPRDGLVKQLLEYRKYKEAAQKLATQAADRERRLPRGSEPATPTVTRTPVHAVELWDLVGAFGRLMQEAQALEPKDVVSDETPQHVYAERVRECVAANGRVSLVDLIERPYRRFQLIGYFLAILELIKSGEIALEQPDPFGDIWLTKAPDVLLAESESDGHSCDQE